MKAFIIACVTFFVTAAATAHETVLLTTTNTLTLRGEITAESMAKASTRLVELLVKRGIENYPIYLVLDSPGGDIDAGEDFIEFAKIFRNVKTISIFAASMASAIVEALPGERLMTDSGILMFHRAKGSVGGQFETGELESRLKFYKEFVRRMEQRSADRMSMSLAEYKNRVKDEMWLSAGSALRLKAADNIISVSCSKDLIDGKEIIVQQIFIFQVKLKYSNCPLFRAPELAPDTDEKAREVYNKSKKSFATNHAK